MSSCTTTVPNSVRNSDPVGHTSRQAAWVQCLQTSEAISQRWSRSGWAAVCPPGGPGSGMPMSTGARGGPVCSTNATCRQVFAPSSPVLS
jgi:hypothetical protein